MKKFYITQEDRSSENKILFIIEAEDIEEAKEKFIERYSPYLGFGWGDLTYMLSNNDVYLNIYSEVYEIN